MDSFESLQPFLNEGLTSLTTLWEEIGLDHDSTRDRKTTVFNEFKKILDKMLEEERHFKGRLLKNLENNSRLCYELSKEMGVRYDEPDSSLSLLMLQKAVKAEAKKLEVMKEERMREVLKLKNMDEDLCMKLNMDPYFISGTTVPTTAQLDGLKDHIRRMEELKFDREEQFITMKETILSLYEELEEEPLSDMEREVACEDTERFTLSASNLTEVGNIQRMLQNQVKANQKQHLAMVEKIESLYERLRLDMSEKYKFLSLHQGHGKSVLSEMRLEIDRLEEIKKANLEQFINNLRNELHAIWDECFYSPDQREDFQALHSIDFTEELLEEHEAELNKMKEYLAQNKDLFVRVAQRQEVWSKFMELERRAKDPTRLMNSRGNQLLLEEKERNKVNKQLPRIEQELHDLIDEWEKDHGKEFRVNGKSFAAFIEHQKEEHIRALEMEKMAREKAKKENLLHETRFGAKPSTPAKLRSLNSTKTPRKTPLSKASASTSHLVRKVSSAVSSIRSPRAGRIAKGTSPRFGTAVNKNESTLKTKRRSSYGIKKIDAKNKKVTTVAKKMGKGILTESTYTLVNGNKSVLQSHGQNLSIASTIPDYANFKQGDKLNSTEAMSRLTPEVSRSYPSYMTPTASAANKMFKTPTGSVSRSRLGTPKSMSKSTPQLSRLRSGKNLPMLF